jgi:hypothetical protein
MGRLVFGLATREAVFFAASVIACFKATISVNAPAHASSNRAQRFITRRHSPMKLTKLKKLTKLTKPSRIVPFLFGFLVTTAPSAHAELMPNAQWRAAETTLFDLIQNGYGIVAVTSVAARSSGLPEDTYILQKNNSVFRCVETRAAEVTTTRATGRLRCAELVKPYNE